MSCPWATAALDRLGRKTRIILDLVNQVVEASCELVSCKESLGTNTPADRFVLTIFAALTQLERDTILDRTPSGGRRDGEKGGRLPHGYVRTLEGNVAAAQQITDDTRND
jgi:DNA invertase Pin-like site-specific DNA recombinase